jgi:hypothetical protein
MDLVGPITSPSVSGFNYILTVVDQYSSFKFCQFLKAKLDTFGKFEKLTKLMENLQDTKIKEIVTNGGGEFINAKFKIYVAENGINHIVSPPETPKHNGYAEQANCTISDKACSLLMTSKLPNTFWVEAVNMATFISNL